MYLNSGPSVNHRIWGRTCIHILHQYTRVQGLIKPCNTEHMAPTKIPLYRLMNSGRINLLENWMRQSSLDALLQHRISLRPFNIKIIFTHTSLAPTGYFIPWYWGHGGSSCVSGVLGGRRAEALLFLAQNLLSQQVLWSARMSNIGWQSPCADHGPLEKQHPVVFFCIARRFTSRLDLKYVKAAVAPCVLLPAY